MRHLLLTVLLLSPAAQAVEPYSADAFAKAQKANKQILLDFHADWCPNCRLQQMAFDRLEKAGKLKNIVFLRLNYDKEKELEAQYHVGAQATIIAFKGAKELARSTGLNTDEKLDGFLKEAFK